MNFLQGDKLRVAVSAPTSAREDNDQRSPTQKIGRTPEHSVTIRQLEAGRLVAGLESACCWVGRVEVIDGVVDSCQPLGRHQSSQFRGQLFELLSKRHVQSKAGDQCFELDLDEAAR